VDAAHATTGGRPRHDEDGQRSSRGIYFRFFLGALKLTFLVASDLPLSVTDRSTLSVWRAVRSFLPAPLSETLMCVWPARLDRRGGAAQRDRALVLFGLLGRDRDHLVARQGLG
jgi:hypothetical protein